MAHLLRGKQAGIANDLSVGLGPDLFVLDHVSPCVSPLCEAVSPIADTCRFATGA
jgi:hypothetical protein